MAGCWQPCILHTGLSHSTVPEESGSAKSGISTTDLLFSHSEPSPSKTVPATDLRLPDSTPCWGTREVQSPAVGREQMAVPGGPPRHRPSLRNPQAAPPFAVICLQVSLLRKVPVSPFGPYAVLESQPHGGWRKQAASGSQSHTTLLPWVPECLGAHSPLSSESDLRAKPARTVD